MGISPVNSRLVCVYIDKVVEAKVIRPVANLASYYHLLFCTVVYTLQLVQKQKQKMMRCDTNCLTDWADEF